MTQRSKPKKLSHTTASPSEDGPGVSAGPILWVPPGALRFKLRSKTAMKLVNSEVAAGDWDLQRVEVDQTAKHQSIVERFRDGVAWENTVLFQRYAAKLARGRTVRGFASLAELADNYRATIDPLYADMRESGFVFERADNKWNTPILIYIGRDGELLLGGSGNHRIAIARTLKLKRVACRVLCRHAEWQELRDKLANCEAGSRPTLLGAISADHPDLQDLLPGSRVERAS